MSASELLGFDSGGAALHVDNLAVAEGDDHGIPPPQLPVLIPQLRCSDDLVVTDAGEGQILDCPSAACVQDLTGLVWPASGGCVLPPEVSLGRPTPLCVFCEERDERLGIAAIQGLGCSTKLVDHSRSMARADQEDESPFVGLLQVGAV
jgi:hypothetical protein